MKSFMEAMDFRHACKRFDETKKISKEDFRFILEAGRKSPSSFGLEHWHFLVITNDHVKAALRPACWNQPQVTNCSHFVVLLAKKPCWFEKGSEYLDISFGRKTGGDMDAVRRIEAVFENFKATQLKPSIEDWSKMQAYIASANMMTGAAAIGIDSCPIEGFSYEELEEALMNNIPIFDDNKYSIAYAIAFGYRAKAQSRQLRLPLSEVTTFVE